MSFSGRVHIVLLPRMSKYEVLGVSQSASLQDIKSAYQAAALATHPDKQASLATEVLKKQVCVGRARVYFLPSPSKTNMSA